MSRFLLAQAPRHLPPWLIFGVRQKIDGKAQLMDLLLVILGCRASTPGERLVLMGLLRIGLAASAIALLVEGHTSRAYDSDVKMALGYACLAGSLFWPLIKMAVSKFIDDRF